MSQRHAYGIAQTHTRRSEEEKAYALIGSSLPESCITLFAWACLQSSPIAWPDAVALARSSRVYTEQHTARRWRKRKAYYVRLDQDLIHSHGLIFAVRWAGWHAPGNGTEA